MIVPGEAMIAIASDSPGTKPHSHSRWLGVTPILSGDSNTQRPDFESFQSIFQTGVSHSAVQTHQAHILSPVSGWRKDFLPTHHDLAKIQTEQLRRGSGFLEQCREPEHSITRQLKSKSSVRARLRQALSTRGVEIVERRKKWSRRCPDCGTEFSSVQCWGICPQCNLRFLVDDVGNVIDSGDRPADRLGGIPLSDRTRNLISKRFSKTDGTIISDMLYRAVSANIPFCDDSSPEDMERIRFAILKMTLNSPLNLAVGIYLAQSDWRDLLMSAGFGDDAAQHMTWYNEQMQSKSG
jgi:hypothetical protein